MSIPSSVPRTTAPLAARGMWVIAIVLAIGALSLLTSALPGRARPLFILPLAFGVATAAIAIGLRRSLALRPNTAVWLVTAAVALGGYGQVVASSFREYQAATADTSESDQNALIALQMLEGAENAELRQQLQAELAARRQSWDQFLSRRYAALGTVSPRRALIGLVTEALLVIAGVAMGRRFLDARRSSCQAAGTISVHHGSTPPG